MPENISRGLYDQLIAKRFANLHISDGPDPLVIQSPIRDEVKETNQNQTPEEFLDHVFDERGAEDPINTILGIIGQAMAQPDPPRFDAFRQFLAELPHSVDLVESIHSLPARQIRTTVTALLMQTSPFINNFAMLWYIHNLNQSLPGNPPNYLGDPPNFMGIQSGDTTTDSPENNL